MHSDASVFCICISVTKVKEWMNSKNAATMNCKDYLTDDNYDDASNKFPEKLSLTDKHQAKETPPMQFIVISPVNCKVNPQISIIQVSHLQQSQNTLIYNHHAAFWEIIDIQLNPPEADKCNCHKAEILKHLNDSTDQ